MAGQFHKQITNARNSNDDFAVQVEDDPTQQSHLKRVSADYLQRSIIHGVGTKRNFATITPQGLPADLVGTNDAPVERQNVLIEPRGQKNEAARLPPFKPFKTISDEDNIHLLPGETGERARINLLDTKVVTEKDVDEVQNAYMRLREQYPELYRKQQAPEIDVAKANPPPVPDQKKKTLLGKLFGKKKGKDKDHKHGHGDATPPQAPPPEPEEKKKHEHDPHEKRKSESSAKPKQQSENSPPQPHQPQRHHHKITIRDKHSSSESESTSESSSEDETSSGYSYDQASHYQYMDWYQKQAGQYPGFPGGYGPYNSPYPGGYGPMQGPYNPCCIDEIQYINDRKRCQEARKGRKLHKPQGLNFDFLPHDDLATEVTMIIEPDEPEPLQYAVENGIMPIICCYMPSAVAVSQQQQTAPPFQGYPVNSMGGGGSASYYASSFPYGSNSNPNSGSGSGTTSSYPKSMQTFGQGTVVSPSTM